METADDDPVAPAARGDHLADRNGACGILDLHQQPDHGLLRPVEQVGEADEARAPSPRSRRRALGNEAIADRQIVADHQ